MGRHVPRSHLHRRPLKPVGIGAGGVADGSGGPALVAPPRILGLATSSRWSGRWHSVTLQRWSTIMPSVDRPVYPPLHSAVRSSVFPIAASYNRPYTSSTSPLALDVGPVHTRHGPHSCRRRGQRRWTFASRSAPIFSTSSAGQSGGTGGNPPAAPAAPCACLGRAPARTRFCFRKPAAPRPRHGFRCVFRARFPKQVSEVLA